MGQHEGMMELHRNAGKQLQAHQKCLEANLAIVEDLQHRVVLLERDVKRNTHWRYECIERRMERTAQIRKIRKAFGVAAGVLWLLFLLVCILVDAEILGMLPGAILMVGFGGLGYVCLGKAGWLDP